MPLSLLDTCHLFVPSVKVFSALLFLSKESPWEASVNKVCKVTETQTYIIPFSRPLFRDDDISQKDKLVIEIVLTSAMHSQIVLKCILRIPVLH